METMTPTTPPGDKYEIIAQLRRDGNYDFGMRNMKRKFDHSTTKTGWKL